MPGGSPAADCLAGSGRGRTLAVTLGLPSRSPPIQEPKRMGQASMGSSRPVCFFSEAEMRRSSLGREDHSDCSTMCSPPRASAGCAGAGGGGGGGGEGGSRQCPGWWARTHGKIMAKLFIWQPVNAGMVPTRQGSSGKQQCSWAESSQAGQRTVQRRRLAAAQLICLPERGDFPAAGRGSSPRCQFR